MKTGLAAVSLFMCVGWASPVLSISITNRDDRQHKLTVIIEGVADQSLNLEPQAVLDGVCPKACIIRLNDSADDEYELEGTAIVSIEGGELYYDGPEVLEGAPPSADQPGAAPQTAPPASPEAPKKQ